MAKKKRPLTRAAWIKNQFEEVLRRRGLPRGLMTLQEAAGIAGMARRVWEALS